MIEAGTAEQHQRETVGELRDHLVSASVDGYIVLESRHSIATSDIVYYWNGLIGNENRSVQDHARPYETFIPSWLNKQELIEDGKAEGKLIIPKYLRPDFERLILAELDKPLEERTSLALGQSNE